MSQRKAVSSSDAGSFSLLKSVNPTATKSLISIIVLALCCFSGFASRLFAVIRFESIIHEFDPWFNYRSTAYMVNTNFYKFLNWFDDRAWYPLGRIVGGTVYPGLMITSGSIHYLLSLINVNVNIREICVFLAPLFSGLTAISTYLLTKELWSQGAGLFAACFISIVPGYISRSVAGSYDNEGIAIFALMFTFYLWIKAVKEGSVFWAVLCSLSYFYMVSAWGGYVFIINLIPLHVFALILMNRFSHRIYVAYCSFFIVGLLCSMQIPFVGFQPVKTSEHMASAGVFCLLQAVAFLKYLQSFLTKSDFKLILYTCIILVCGVGVAGLVGLTVAGVIAPWSGRFYSLWDTEYAKIHIPIIASVSEHQPTTWFSFFFDLHILVCVFPAGVYLSMRRLTDELVFIVIYAVFGAYFAGVMVRLMLTLTPCVCVLSAIAFSTLFDRYLHFTTYENVANNNGSNGVSSNAGTNTTTANNSSDEKRFYDKAGGSSVSTPRQRGGTKGSSSKNVSDGSCSVSGDASQGSTESGVGFNIQSIVVCVAYLLIIMFALHCTWVTSMAYSSPSVVLSSQKHDGTRNILDDFREAYYWLWQNTPEDATVMSWWDYGYQIAGMANRTTLVDNNTWNNSHIALVGKAMSSNESEAYNIMTELNVDYVLVIFGGVIGYSGDDINKFLWMVRIAEGEHPKDIRESDYFARDGGFRVDAHGSKILLNCLMYKLSYYRFAELGGKDRGFDRTRNTIIGNQDFDLTYLEEAFTSEHWLVRIYRVKKPHEFNRQPIPPRDRMKAKKVSASKLPSKRSRSHGIVLDQPSIIKGGAKASQKPLSVQVSK